MSRIHTESAADTAHALSPPDLAEERAEIAHRDAGLAKSIGPLGMAAITFNILMGSGYYVVPGEMARLGSWAPLAVVLCGLVVSAVLVCLAEGSSRVPTSGGIYGFVEAAFGRRAGVVIGAVTWVMITFAAAAVLAAAVDQAGRLFPIAATAPGRVTVAVLICATFAWIASSGAEESAGTMKVFVVVKLLPLLVFLGAALWLSPAGGVAAAGGETVAAGGIGKSLLLGIFLFFGAESALTVSGEVRNPARNIPLGLLGAMALYGGVGVLVQWTVWHAAGTSVTGSTAPISDITARLAPALLPYVGGGAMLAAIGCVGGMILCAPRILFGYARDGILPAGLGQLSAKSQTPVRAIWANALVIALITLSGGYVILASIATLFGIVIYVAGAAAALRLRARDVALAGPPLRFAISPIAGWIGMAAMLAVAATASRNEFLITGAVLAGIALLAWLRTPRDPVQAR